MNCTLTFEQQKQFYKKVFKDLSVIVSDNKDFDIKNYILDFYSLVNDKTNDNKNNENNNDNYDDNYRR